MEELKYAKEMKLAEFRKRSLGEKAVEQVAVLLSRLL